MSTRRFSCAVSLVIICAACGDGGPSERKTQTSPTAQGEPWQSHVIPVEFRGRWAEVPAACLSHNTRRYEISAIQIDRADFSGSVQSVTVAGSAANVRLEVDNEAVAFRMVLDDANTMRTSYGTREEFILYRCR